MESTDRRTCFRRPIMIHSSKKSATCQILASSKANMRRHPIKRPAVRWHHLGPVAVDFECFTALAWQDCQRRNFNLTHRTRLLRWLPCSLILWNKSWLRPPMAYGSEWSDNLWWSADPPIIPAFITSQFFLGLTASIWAAYWLVMESSDLSRV